MARLGLDMCSECRCDCVSACLCESARANGVWIAFRCRHARVTVSVPAFMTRCMGSTAHGCQGVSAH
eukprot:5439989-Alexandrium_andersonii.AAC.1